MTDNKCVACTIKGSMYQSAPQSTKCTDCPQNTRHEKMAVMFFWVGIFSIS